MGQKGGCSRKLCCGNWEEKPFGGSCSRYFFLLPPSQQQRNAGLLQGGLDWPKVNWVPGLGASASLERHTETIEIFKKIAVFLIFKINLWLSISIICGMYAWFNYSYLIIIFFSIGKFKHSSHINPSMIIWEHLNEGRAGLRFVWLFKDPFLSERTKALTNPCVETMKAK